MLELQNIHKRWSPSFAHEDINLRIEHGEFLVLLGPSGAGKTLLLELIAGFHRPDSGQILLDGQDVTRLAPERRNIGFVYQDQMLFPHKTVRRNIAYGLEVRRTAKSAIAEKVAYLADLLHLEPIIDRPASRLSIGQKQRVALARALAIEPDLLLLDEPFSSLDPPLQQRLSSELKKLHETTGFTALHVTHDRAEAQYLGQHIGVIQEGHIKQIGADHSVFQQPNSHFVAEFTGGRNIYEGHARALADLTEFHAGPLKLLSSTHVVGACKALVRPENIIISRQPIQTSARNQLSGHVETLTRQGDLYQVVARMGDSGKDAPLMTCVITPQSVEELEIAPGARVYYSFKVGGVHLFKDDTPSI